MVAAGYVVEGIFFMLWGIVVTVLSGYQLWLRFVVLKRNSNLKNTAESSRIPKVAQLMCLTIGILSIIINVDRRTMYGVYSIEFNTFIALIELSPVVTFGLIWFRGIMNVVKDVGIARGFNIPLWVYYLLAITNVPVSIGSWAIAVRTNSIWYYSWQIIYSIIILIICLFITLGLAIFIRRTQMSDSVHVVTPESALRRKALVRKLLITAVILFVVFILGSLVVLSYLANRGMTLMELAIPNGDPNTYTWTATSWAGTSHLLVASIGIGIFWMRAPGATSTDKKKGSSGTSGKKDLQSPKQETAVPVQAIEVQAS
jgi:predicted secreted protein